SLDAAPSEDASEAGEPVESRSPSVAADVEARPAFAGLDEYADRQETEFGRCLTNRARHLRRYPSRGIFCYRLYDKDLPEVPLAIDIFHDLAERKYLHVAEYERPDGRTVGQHRLWLDKMVAKAAEVLEVPSENVFLKRRARQRGESQYEKLGESGRVIRAREGGLTFLCNMTDYLDVGLFLDHRQTRDMARKEARGKRFLNLFCYSGAFTCYALDGGAASSVSVDLSPTYLSWTAANLEENGFAAPRGSLVKADVMKFLRAIPPASARNRDIVRLIEETAAELSDPRAFSPRDRKRRDARRERYQKETETTGPRNFGVEFSDFELCVCDPPTFSNSKSTESDWDVQRRHVELLRLLATRMVPGGVVYFSNNYRRFKLDEEKLADLYDLREISNRTVPDDFRNKRIHRCWRMVAK
ncbi:MAG: class I SAM-dependent methyltransferase, partial [Thermoguttaceae bacterium]|nr:class I SAM-dependent methyltransferase [Thermoguttaceae bacterium]